MKTVLYSSLALLTLSGFASWGCTYNSTVDLVDNLCDQTALDNFEYLPVGGDMGSFEPGFSPATDGLIVDDDDLLDDYPVWVAAVNEATARFAEQPELVTTFENIPPETDRDDYTAEQEAAVVFVEELNLELSATCLRLTEPLIAPHPGDRISDGRYPSFTACKDKYNASGDGIVATFELLREGHQAQDAEMATCNALVGTPNTQALNVWGPLTTDPSSIPNLPDNVYDGFPYSGITVPLTIATYQQTADFSEWEGIAFWARDASASEAVPIQNTPADAPPMSGKTIPPQARPQDGVGSIGIIIQTMDTAAVLDTRGNVDGLQSVGICADGIDPSVPDDMGMYPFCLAADDFDSFPGEIVNPDDPTTKYAYKDSKGRPQSPETPYCIDYSPVDTKPGEETPFRDQCWDGFRTMVDLTHEWRFYRLPFSEMRQAGWGRVAEAFRTDQIRSVNVLGTAFQPMNVMIDEIAYYRRKAPAPAATTP